MSFFSQIFGRRDQRRLLLPLYQALAAEARDPAWYREGAVPDSIDGRFDILAALIALLLLRLERDQADRARESALLTELFIDDMDASLRQIGIGDFVVGKHVGRMMGALGGQLGAFRDAADLRDAVRRNIFHEAPPSEHALAFVAGRLTQFRDALIKMRAEPILEGRLP